MANIHGESRLCDIPEAGEIGVGISGTQNYLVYSAWKDSTHSLIRCYSVAHNPPKYLWQFVCKAWFTKVFKCFGDPHAVFGGCCLQFR